ncbi:hypothetical protein [Polynucleobacter sp. HIN7]|uniref:hypothetical protein n=1 Tax=Polynucleobacter sp. HIN7 TaxID=3047866 RepID=UPI0025736CCB|nr:hypothetical protein [Polynucleobacter sp. HIN7]BEI36596.1 hypothetical protein PHIN7_03200 [Polynucleobacter sp. HIN7]
MLNLIIDTILPGDRALNLPPASEINIDIYLSSYRKQELISEFLNLTKKVCLNKFKSNFSELSGADRLKALEACKSANIRLFTDFITNVLKAYYTNAKVLETINSGSIPPFPVGNVLENDDWEILEPVFERGRVYRSINPKF